MITQNSVPLTGSTVQLFVPTACQEAVITTVHSLCFWCCAFTGAPGTVHGHGVQCSAATKLVQQLEGLVFLLKLSKQQVAAASNPNKQIPAHLLPVASAA